MNKEEQILSAILQDKLRQCENRNIPTHTGFLSAADVFVFPSLYEGLPLTLVEAQTSGLPVVCSDRITEETKLSENYYSLSLNAPVSEWADLIIQQGRKENHRSNSYLAIRQKHYDSTDVVTKMEKYYLKVSNSNS